MYGIYGWICDTELAHFGAAAATAASFTVVMACWRRPFA